MKVLGYTSLVLVSILNINCGGNEIEKKGFAIRSVSETSEEKVEGISEDSLSLETRPSNVLLTGFPDHRLTTIYMVNHKKKKKTSFIGSNYFHYNYSEEGHKAGNRWHRHFMPGFNTVYGYNMVNVSHYSDSTRVNKNLFEKPVLVKTLYYPSYEQDSLFGNPVNRDYYLCSAYNEDTNEDGYINVKDLRRFFHFDINGNNLGPLIESNYSVMKSEYDPANDYMYVFAKLDENDNGQMDDNESIHIYWIDLNNPHKTGRAY